MQEILRSNDAVLLSFAEVLLRDAGLSPVLVDGNMSILEGSLGILPRRLMVGTHEVRKARRVLADAGLGPWCSIHDRS